MTPHKYSAVKINGVRAYQKSRNQEEFNMPEKQVSIREFTILDYQYPFLKYRCTVSKGTYIRSLSVLIAEKLKTVAYTKELVRTAIGRIGVYQSYPVSEVRSENLENILLPPEYLLSDFPLLTLDTVSISRVIQGNTVINQGEDSDILLIRDTNGQFIGIACRKDNYLHLKINL